MNTLRQKLLAKEVKRVYFNESVGQVFLKEKIVEILRDFRSADIDLEPERTNLVEKAEAEIKTEQEYASQILSLFSQSQAEQVKAIEKIPHEDYCGAGKRILGKPCECWRWKVLSILNPKR